jgi:carbohydrate diacid regulator
MLTEELALTIVNKLIAVLGKNINLMNEEGYIIASGDATRVGSFHEGSVQVIQTRRPLEIKARDEEMLEGVRQGINLPIILDNRVVGAVGITGEPAEVRGYGELVRYTVEMMLEQAALKEEVHLQERARDIFFQDLISGNWGDEKLFILRGTLIGMDLLQPRVAVVLDFTSDDVGYPSAVTMPEQRELNTVVTAVQAFFTQAGWILGMVGTARLVLLVPVRLNISKQQQRMETEKIVGQLRKLTEKHTSARFIIGVGSYSEGLEGLKCSYREGLAALNMGTRFRPGSGKYFYEDMQLERMITAFPGEERAGFISAMIEPLLENEGDANYDNQLMETLEVYFEESQSIKKASERLYVHRNTLMHRLKKIEKRTGYNPSAFADAFKLRLALLLYRADK